MQSKRTYLRGKKLYECSKGRKSERLIGTADGWWRGINSLRLIWQDTRSRTRVLTDFDFKESLLWDKDKAHKKIEFVGEKE